MADVPPGRPADTEDPNKPSSNRLSATELPKAIGPYRVLDVLGEGGMGVVYLAEQREPIHRRVAVKVVKLGMDSKAILARFDAERQALSMMNHDAIARVHDCGATVAGQPYFAMEYVKGVPITDYCDRNALSLSARLALFQQVCAGVQHAHLKGVMHRDLKPSNVLVGEQDGRPVVKIIDFGLAKAIDHRLVEATLFTQLGQVLGTPEYMSPEQAGIDGLDVDTRTDVYSLGVLLYELLTGQLPFSRKQLLEAGWLELKRVLREQEPPRPSTRVTMLGASSESVARARQLDTSALMRQLRGDLDWVVLRALEKNRTRRYSTPSELAADVERFLRQETVLARPPSAIYRLRKVLTRHRGVVIAAAAILLTAVIGAVVAIDQAFEARRQAGDAAANARRADERAGEADRERQRADAEARRALALADEATQNAYGATMVAASVSFDAGRHDIVRRALNDAPAAMRGWEWRQFDAALNGWSGVVPGFSLAFHPDGTQLAVASGNAVRLCDPRTGAEVRGLQALDGKVFQLAFRADGRQVVAVHDDGSLSVVDVETDRIVRRRSLPSLLKPYSHRVAFSPDGAIVAVVGERGVDGSSRWQTQLWTLEEDSLQTFEGRGGFVGPARRLLLTDCPSEQPRRSCVVVFDASGERGMVEVARWVADGGAANRDGTQVAIRHRSVLTVQPVRGDVVARLMDPASQHCIADGFCLADQAVYSVFDNVILVRSAVDGEARAELVTGLTSVTHVALCRDGTRLSVGTLDGRTQVWDLRDARRLSEFRCHSGSVLVSPDLEWTVEMAWDPVIGSVARVFDLGGDNVRRFRGVVAVSDDLSRVATEQTSVEVHQLVDRSRPQAFLLERADDVVGWCDTTQTLLTLQDGVLRQRSTTDPVRVWRHAEKDICAARVRAGGGVVALTVEGHLFGWDLRSGARQFDYAGPAAEPLNFLRCSSDGRYLDRGGQLEVLPESPVYDLLAGKQVLARRSEFRGFVPGERVVVVDPEDPSRICFWDLATGQSGLSCTDPGRMDWDAHGARWISIRRRGPGPARVHDGRTGAVVSTFGDQVHEGRLSRDGSRALTIHCDENGDNVASVWEVATGGLVRRLVTGAKRIDVAAPDLFVVQDAQAALLFHADGTEAGRIDCSRGGVEVVGASSAHLMVQRYDVVVHDVVGGAAAVHHAWEHVAFDRGGRFLLGLQDSHLELRNCATGGTATLGVEYPTEAVFAPDSSQLAMFASDESTVTFWDTATAKLRASMTLPEMQYDILQSPGWSADGRWLTIPGRPTVVVDVARAAVAFTLPVAAVAATFSPDGGRLAFVDEGLVVMETATWQRRFTTEWHLRVFQPGVAWAPRGDRLAVWDDEGVTIVDATTGQRVGALRLATDTKALAWSPDATRLATGADDHVVRIWNATTGAELAQLHGLEETIERVQWSSDGLRLLALDRKQIACIWDGVRLADRRAGK